ncbi:recombinase family protein [Roseomonas sp. SSH11]|uniref:Recombinase family protein n=1 Tax=Pararoseomonas baculiformis TaxID=2820812 RepID=A0ABS4A826_9PROT|nr:recombinase family protein [Pararoseomonas baculiformis]
MIGYVRVSTADQSIDLQRNALIAAGAAVIHADEGISGAAPDRPGLLTALQDLRPGDMLTVWKLDRLGRTAIDSLSASREAEAS